MSNILLIGPLEQNITQMIRLTCNFSHKKEEVPHESQFKGMKLGYKKKSKQSMKHKLERKKGSDKQVQRDKSSDLNENGCVDESVPL